MHIHLNGEIKMNNFFDKYGPWALITGASKGIGLEYSRHSERPGRTWQGGGVSGVTRLAANHRQGHRHSRLAHPALSLTPDYHPIHSARADSAHRSPRLASGHRPAESRPRDHSHQVKSGRLRIHPSMKPSSLRSPYHPPGRTDTKRTS